MQNLPWIIYMILYSIRVPIRFVARFFGYNIQFDIIPDEDYDEWKMYEERGQEETVEIDGIVYNVNDLRSEDSLVGELVMVDVKSDRYYKQYGMVFEDKDDYLLRVKLTNGVMTTYHVHNLALVVPKGEEDE